MKSKIFSTDQIRAIQDGRMTQFMQFVKPQPWSGEEYGGAGYGWSEKGKESNCYKWNTNMQSLANHIALESPFGKVGGVIYCRETWSVTCSGKFEYKADGGLPPKIIWGQPDDGEDYMTCTWYPSATMPREAARLFLRITNIRVMRVQELTEQDAIKQGYGCVCSCKNPVYPGACENCYNTGYSYPPMLDLKKTNETFWSYNFWMWVIDFDKIEKP